MSDTEKEEVKEIRIFTRKQKEECWNKATLMQGRHKDRWRLDVVGNPVLKHLTNCRGPLCYNFDHIHPHSKGGKTDVDNCQLLQSFVNIYKSNKTELTLADLRKVSPRMEFTWEHLDVIEKAIYGNVLKPDQSAAQK